jgi:hypothetical protein
LGDDALAEKLFAVCLGGRAPKCNTELHDVVFAIGETIEATYDQLIAQWFGTPVGLHIDSWAALRLIDGHRISLSRQPHGGPEKLFFINLGAYADGQFMELHANLFVVDVSAKAAKAKAKALLRERLPGHLHTDDLHDVDDYLAIREVSGWHIAIEKTDVNAIFEPVNGYHVVPEAAILRFMAAQAVLPPPA